MFCSAVGVGVPSAGGVVGTLLLGEEDRRGGGEGGLRKSTSSLSLSRSSIERAVARLTWYASSLARLLVLWRLAIWLGREEVACSELDAIRLDSALMAMAPAGSLVSLILLGGVTKMASDWWSGLFLLNRFGLGHGSELC